MGTVEPRSSLPGAPAAAGGVTAGAVAVVDALAAVAGAAAAGAVVAGAAVVDPPAASMACSTSCRRIRPPTPVPDTFAKSMPARDANLRTNGVT